MVGNTIKCLVTLLLLHLSGGTAHGQTHNSIVLGEDSLATPPALAVQGAALEIQLNDLQKGLEWAETSYIQIGRAAQDILGRELGPKDFYTGLRLKSNIDANTIKYMQRGCSGSEDAGWYYVLGASINYQGRKGTTPINIADNLPLLVIASNYDVKNGRVRAGCAVRVAPDRDPSYLLYDSFGPREGEYRASFEALQGTEANSTIFARVHALAAKVAPAWQNIASSGAIQQVLATEIAADLDFLRTKDAGPNVPYSARLKASGMPATASGKTPVAPQLVLTLPWAMKASATDSQPLSISIYSRPSASIVLDWANGHEPDKNVAIRAIDVVANEALGARHDCILGVGECRPRKFSESLQDKGTFLISQLYLDPGRRVQLWLRLSATCRDVRAAAVELRLSTVDALLVRWAVLARGKAITSEGKFVGNQEPYKKSIAESKVEDLSNECWRDGEDLKMLRAIEKAANKTFVVSD